jgi:hypothetical protein
MAPTRSRVFETYLLDFLYLSLTAALDVPQWRKLPFTISAPFQVGAPPHDPDSGNELADLVIA